jgi:hypothetical protein
MMDGDQAIMIGEGAERGVRERFDIPDFAARLREEFVIAAREMRRPSTLYRPELSIDGDQWMALYGDNIQEGVAGFGDSPEEVYRDFDRVWYEKLPFPNQGPRGDSERAGHNVRTIPGEQLAGRVGALVQDHRPVAQCAAAL